MISRRFISTVLFLITSALAIAPVAAQDAAAPTLAVHGIVAGVATDLVFTREALENLGMVIIKTATPWNKGVVTFEGVPFTVLLKAAGMTGTTATVTALNDYSVEMPIADFDAYGVILAIKRDGAYMPTDDQGPFFVIYPFDSDPALQSQPYYGRAVWQVKEISVE